MFENGKLIGQMKPISDAKDFAVNNFFDLKLLELKIDQIQRSKEGFKL